MIESTAFCTPPCTLVTLCRFENGQLIKRQKMLEQTDYIAVSHVWGDIKWRRVREIQGEVLASQEKVIFLETQLQSIVGSGWFWMDILCINQRSTDERIGIIAHIQTIFSLAKRTLAVRESWGFHPCCNEAVDKIRKYFDRSASNGAARWLIEHWQCSPGHLGRSNEGFLTRLWPLQELLCSRVVQYDASHLRPLFPAVLHPKVLRQSLVIWKC